jgi:hypothetical protein
LASGKIAPLLASRKIGDTTTGCTLQGRAAWLQGRETAWLQKEAVTTSGREIGCIWYVRNY